MRDPSAETDEVDLLIALNTAPIEHRALLVRWAGARHGGGGDADPARVASLPRAGERLARSARRIARGERERARRAGARIVTLAEESYPSAFRTLELPPPAIYVQGSIPDGPAVAVVGARKASGYGLEVAAWLARELAGAGVTIVSGFAVGVDAAAHAGALERGETVAVLGCGHDIDYPTGHRELGARIARSGARISEFPPGTLPSPWRFPVRNRLIAALGQACVVVEAAPRSGSLVTARLALELGREVLAVPGRVLDELALGVNSLLADGARPVLDPRDVLEAIGVRALSRTPADEPRGLAAAPLALWRAAHAEAAGCEQLAARAGLPVARALVAALELELTGLLRRRPDGAYETVGTAHPGARR